MATQPTVKRRKRVTTNRPAPAVAPGSAWDFALTDFLAGVESGQYDDRLREIARAVFARRDVLNGTSTVIPDGTPAVVPTVLSTPPTGVIADDEPNVLRSNSVVPVSFASMPKTSTNLFEYQGRYYRKSDLLGREVCVPSGVLRDALYTGHRIKIMGVGPKRVKAMWTTYPTSKRNSRMREAFEHGEEFYVTREVLREVLAR